MKTKMKNVLNVLNAMADTELSDSPRKPRKEPKWARELRARLDLQRIAAENARTLAPRNEDRDAGQALVSPEKEPRP